MVNNNTIYNMHLHIFTLFIQVCMEACLEKQFHSLVLYFFIWFSSTAIYGRQNTFSSTSWGREANQLTTSLSVPDPKSLYLSSYRLSTVQIRSMSNIITNTTFLSQKLRLRVGKHPFSILKYWGHGRQTHSFCILKFLKQVFTIFNDKKHRSHSALIDGKGR